MALSFVLSSQTYIGIMDRIEHAQHHVHFANPLAGDIEFCVGGPDICADHDGADQSFPHHHGDAALVFLAATMFVLPIQPDVESRCETEPLVPASVSPRGPDHPPKPCLEIRV